MAEDRSTSFAKDVSFDTEKPNSLDHQAPVSPDFENAQADFEAADGQGQASEQVGSTGMAADLHPDGADYDAVQAESHTEAMARDHEAAVTNYDYEEDYQEGKAAGDFDNESGNKSENGLDYDNEY